MADEDIAIGIDLGTTYSCVAVWKNKKVEIIPNDLGERTTPSVVSFTNNERLVGQAAKNQITRNYKNTIYDAKRLIGRRFNEEEVQKDLKLWPFKVEKDSNSDRPIIVVEYLNQTKTFYPEEISAMVLEKMKKYAEDYLGKPVTQAIVTCPAYFNDGQRQATKDAGRIAGLNVMRMINEPTAAAIAYGLNNQQQEKNILVFDLGGGTFDVSILNVDDTLFEVRATRGDTHLGGEDFDHALLNFCIEEFKNDSGVDISNNQKALRRLKVACEKAKRDLSSAQQTNIDIAALSDGEDFNVNITRPQFEDMCSELFNKCKKPIEEALKDANLDKKYINEIILVGGSTRIPKIQSIVKDFFNGKELNKTINPDEAVAYGAAVQAAIVNNVEDDGLEKLTLLDVAPLSLGVEIVGDKMSFIIPRNTTIPTKITKNYTTSYDDQTFINFPVYQGEHNYSKSNHLLGTFSLQNIRKAPKGEVKVEVTFALDINCILRVSGVEKGGNNEKGGITIKCDNDRLTEQEIERLVEKAEKMREEDRKKLEVIAAKLELENYVYDCKKKVNNLNSDKKNKVLTKCEEELAWIKKNQEATIEQYKLRKKESEKFYNSI